MSQALVIIDIQNDYFAGGRMPLAGPEAAAARAATLLEAFRKRGATVLHVQHISMRPAATFFLPQTNGVMIHDSVAPRAGERLIVKHFPNAFRATSLAEHLRAAAVDELLFVGMMTHMCIDTSVRAAADLGFRCSVAADACATRDLAWGGQTVDATQVQAAFLAALNGAFARVAPAAELLDSI
jgi:nicotinamidase-related amidase